MKVGPKIVDEGLVLCLDAANLSSYSGSGTAVSDLLQTNDADLINGTLFSNDKGGGFVFDGTNDYIDLENANPDYMDSTYPNGLNISLTIKLSDPFPNTSDGRGIISRNSGSASYNAFNLSIQSDRRLRFWMAPYSPIFSQTSLNVGEIYICSINLDAANLRKKWYINGVEEADTSWSRPSSTAQHTNFDIGRWPAGGWYFPGTIYFVKIYDRSLSAQEVVNNYETTKQRFI